MGLITRLNAPQVGADLIEKGLKENNDKLIVQGLDAYLLYHLNEETVRNHILPTTVVGKTNSNFETTVLLVSWLIILGLLIINF